ncbi:MAG TPA: DUF2914 domain-containing protein [Xanthomonadales bacterium]
MRGEKGEHHELSMRNFFKNLLYMMVGLHFMAACSVLQTEQPITELASLQNQRAANAVLSLWDMEEVDALIQLDNQWLKNQFETVIKNQTAVSDVYTLHKLKQSFNNQIITLEALVDVKDELGNSVSANLTGDIRLQYRGKGLYWRPRFTGLEISSRDFSFAGGSYNEPDPELTAALLAQLNTDLALAIIESNQNTIPLSPVPLGEIQVGASLPGFTESTAMNTQSLRGIFMIAGSAVLIDASSTSIALDMAFIPDLSTCPADVTVSRAEFATDVQSREPVGIVRNISSETDARYFYSEIAGAKRPLTIIHYWFEDGLPLTVEELAVGPSERWRTWSRKDAFKSDASQWEVLVVEKESGCILASKSIRAEDPEILITRVNQAQAEQTFTELKNEFNRRTAGFSTIREKPGIALIEVRRPFLRDVLQASLADLSIDTEFDGADLSALQFSAELAPFDPESIICEHRDCTPAPLCKINLTQCKRLRDTRDCSSCQFRNPLNNRCVSEAIDPLCEASRNRQNARYEDERNACISRAENEKKECDRLNAQVLSSCKIESGFNESTCEAVKNSLRELTQDQPLAHVTARTQTSGQLSAHFSNFLIEGDLERLKLDMRLQSRFQLAGELSFKPVIGSQPLASCIAAWNAPFSSRFSSTPEINNLLSNLEQTPSMLTAHWSGFGVSVETQPSPLESMFVENPQLLANCNIGLTVSRVEKAIAGDDAAFFRGQTELVIQALPTKIHFSPATIEFGNMVFSADANLTGQHLQYDIRE